MSSAEMGAPSVRPADVEGWFTGFGLTPTERADRDGITSWDLVLDGRRRFDLRITVILDPALALICWAHYAPPISDMFRKSYRRLLRWNDEFPFAKFSISEDERPVIAVELPVEDEIPAGDPLPISAFARGETEIREPGLDIGRCHVRCGGWHGPRSLAARARACPRVRRRPRP